MSASAAEAAESAGFFEGAEKLLEIWFEPHAEEASDSKCGKGKIGLRCIPRDSIENMLALVKCTILSSVSTDLLDSYVLSESSLFVAAHRIILKTCGGTTLLPAVPKILEMAKGVGLEKVKEIFYSRKSFSRPELQSFPHKGFQQEVEYLDKLFDGSAYALGRVNGDMWYLYTLDKADGISHPDQTLELLMTNLDQEKMKVFYKSSGLSAKQVTEQSGIGGLVPAVVLDEHLFDPCGYSVNAITEDGCYFTIHVTPQEEFSYVSFETDVQCEDCTPLINKVLEIFGPKSFTVTLFANRLNRAAHLGFDDKGIDGFRRQDKQMYEFTQYTLNFGHFSRVADAPAKPAAAAPL